MPFYLIQGRQFSPSYAGLLLSAMPITMAVVAPISGTLSDRIGARLPSTLGMILLGIGLFLFSRLNPQSSMKEIIQAMVTAGLGIGIFISPNNSALMGSAPRHRQGIAAGMLATARNVGMVLGVGLSGAIFTTVLAQQVESTAGLYTAVQVAFFAAIGVALLGALTSAIRGESKIGEEKHAALST